MSLSDYSAEELEKAIDEIGIAALSRKLGVSLTRVKEKAKKLGITFPRPQVKRPIFKNENPKPNTDKKYNVGALADYTKELLERDIEQHGLRILAENLGVSIGAIRQAMKRLNCRSIKDINQGKVDPRSIDRTYYPPLPLVHPDTWPESAFLIWNRGVYTDATLLFVYTVNPSLVHNELKELREDSERYKTIKDFLDWIKTHG